MTIAAILKLIALIVYPIIEYFLGKTKKLQANSVLELILNILESILKMILQGGLSWNKQK